MSYGRPPVAVDLISIEGDYYERIERLMVGVPETETDTLHLDTYLVRLNGPIRARPRL